MKHKKFAAIAAMIVAAGTGGCTGGGGLWMGGAQPMPLAANDVLLLDEAPNWPYRQVGFVQSQGTSLSTDVSVFKGLQEEAAKIGAPAVVVDQDFLDFTATPSDDSLLGMPLKGVAIAPVRLSGSELEQWRRERAAAAVVKKRQPNVQTIGQ
jgi:hypothetical protein